jgi:hypothetical protein
MSRFITFFADDPGYRRFLALHPGLWPEVGVLDDPPLLSHLRRHRRKLGLPNDRFGDRFCDRWLSPARRLDRRKRSA